MIGLYSYKEIQTSTHLSSKTMADGWWLLLNGNNIFYYYQVPLGTDSQGLPIGIQVVAAPYNDALCLTVAKYLEKEFSGSVMACKVKT